MPFPHASSLANDGFTSEDYVRVLPHATRAEPDGLHVVLSFGPRHHVRVSMVARDMIEAFDGVRTVQEVSSHISALYPDMGFGTSDCQEFIDTVLRPHALIEGTSRSDQDGVHAYLWWHVPVVDTNRLARLFGVTKYLFHPIAVWSCLGIITLALVTSIHLTLSSGLHIDHMNGVGVLLATYWSMLVHEAGHVSAAYRCKIRAGRAGIGLYLFFLVFYVDLTNAWRLSRRQRVLVDCGGVYFQILSVLPLAVLGFLTGQAELSAMFLAVVLMSSLNFFPFLRLDGYWIICDALGLSNLAPNAFPVVRQVLSGKFVDRTRTYVLGCALYVASTLIAVLVGLVMFVRLLADRSALSGAFEVIGRDVSSGDWSNAAVDVNHVLILLVPGLLIVAGIVRSAGRKLWAVESD